MGISSAGAVTDPGHNVVLAGRGITAAFTIRVRRPATCRRAVLRGRWRFEGLHPNRSTHHAPDDRRALGPGDDRPHRRDLRPGRDRRRGLRGGGRADLAARGLFRPRARRGGDPRPRVALRRATPTRRCSCRSQQDWVRASLEGLNPGPGRRILVHGAHDRAAVRPNDVAIEIEAALAFGTGHHGTTKAAPPSRTSLAASAAAGSRCRDRNGHPGLRGREDAPASGGGGHRRGGDPGRAGECPAQRDRRAPAALRRPGHAQPPADRPGHFDLVFANIRRSRCSASPRPSSGWRRATGR